jgi:hypothetical protein
MPLTAGLPSLDAELASVGIEGEVLLVGGAVMLVTFYAEPASRRPGDQFADQNLLTEAADRVGSAEGFPSDWLSTAARAVVGTEGPSGMAWEGSHLRVYAPQPPYALAMKCARFGLAPEAEERAIQADVRYLMRLIGLTTASDALGVIGDYFTERQLPDRLTPRLERLLH